MRSFHNSTRETGQILLDFEYRAKKQDASVLQFFQRNRGIWSASEVWMALPELNCPLTSIRRAITNLTHAGHLVKTQYKRTGPYGRPEFTWMVNETTN